MDKYKITIKSWEELEAIASRTDALENLIFSSNMTVFNSDMRCFCGEEHEAYKTNHGYKIIEPEVELEAELETLPEPPFNSEKSIVPVRYYEWVFIDLFISNIETMV